MLLFYKILQGNPSENLCPHMVIHRTLLQPVAHHRTPLVAPPVVRVL